MAATSSSSDKACLITCPTCDYSVPQQPGTKRTICPNCGNFYSRELAERPPSPRRRIRQDRTERGPIYRDNQNDRNKPQGGRLQTIANFFQNLGGGNRRGSASSNQNEQQSGSPQPSDGRSDLLSPVTSPRLPAIGSSQLTVSRGHTPAYAKANRGGSGRHGNPPVVKDVSSGPKSPRPPASPKVNQVPAAPISTLTLEQFQQCVREAKESGNWKGVLDFYASIFDSFPALSVIFKRDPSKDYKTADDSGIHVEYVNAVYDTLMKAPNEVPKEVLKAVINSLLKDRKPHTKDDLRAYLILLQNPQFSTLSTYVIFAHLLRQVAALSDHDHHFLVHWIKLLERDRFKGILERLHNFIACRLFPPKPEDLPPLAKCSWWIPCATKVMALLNAANNLAQPPLVAHTDFYNSTLDHLDLMAEYYAWQNPSSHAGFSFCQYPFILSIAAKRSVLQKDSEQQMIIQARKSLVAKVQRRQLPDVGMLFLNLTIRRAHIVSDSLNEVARKQHDLKKKLKVVFAGEPGLDMGGLTKEWFLLLLRKIFHQDYGMFTYDKRAGVHWFSLTPCENYQEFNLVGVLMGLAVYNSINLDVRFPTVCYRKLLSPAVVPFNNPRATVGIVSVTLDDLKILMPDTARGLQDLLEYDGDVEDDFGLTFEVSQAEFGQMKAAALKPGGENLSVTNDNREEYVSLYCEWVMNRAVYQQFAAFYHGFHSVCASNALIMLRPEEVEMLVCGNPTLVMGELKKVTVYDGYSAQDNTVRYFWDVVLHMPLETQKKLLLFATGSDRVPIGGMGEMTFKISRINDPALLPMSHTCFNQLVLPPYKSRKLLKQKIMTAIQNAEGFGLE
ncbi:probable E3 ubiquitin-protein ligase HECTD2 [Littorina saxatilis]|uniref:probable E3 ubiquitin-protein ligase HECTD2 n=1 Tax=Littorina saxatilis TaxID=31220 RepID=UPI0038B4CA32